MFLDNQKHLFDIEEEVTYLNCAAYTPLLKASYISGLKGLDRKYHPWSLDSMETPAEAEHLRSLFAGLIGRADKIVRQRTVGCFCACHGQIAIDCLRVFVNRLVGFVKKHEMHTNIFICKNFVHVKSPLTLD